MDVQATLHDPHAMYLLSGVFIAALAWLVLGPISIKIQRDLDRQEREADQRASEPAAKPH